MTFFQAGGDQSETTQQCPVCGAEQPPSPRYPRYLCPECVVLASDEAGRRLQFSNVDFGGGFQAVYADTGDLHPSHVCFVRGVRCHADEARFGGIVVQPE